MITDICVAYYVTPPLEITELYNYEIKKGKLLQYKYKIVTNKSVYPVASKVRCET